WDDVAAPPMTSASDTQPIRRWRESFGVRALARPVVRGINDYASSIERTGTPPSGRRLGPPFYLLLHGQSHVHYTAVAGVSQTIGVSVGPGGGRMPARRR